MIDPDTLEFDSDYLPDREVLESAHQFLASITMPMYIDGLEPLSTRVRSIRKMADTAPVTKRSFPKEEDILLYLECEAWSYSGHYWKNETYKDHTLDTLYCSVQYAVIRRSLLLKNEIDPQFGIAEWEDVDVGGFEAKTDSGTIPYEVLLDYFRALDGDWKNLAAEYFDAGCPSLKTLDPRVRELAIEALRRDGQEIDDILEI